MNNTVQFDFIPPEDPNSFLATLTLPYKAHDSHEFRRFTISCGSLDQLNTIAEWSAILVNPDETFGIIYTQMENPADAHLVLNIFEGMEKAVNDLLAQYEQANGKLLEPHQIREGHISIDIDTALRYFEWKWKYWTEGRAIGEIINRLERQPKAIEADLLPVLFEKENLIVPTKEK